jgi:hypothetical protein
MKPALNPNKRVSQKTVNWKWCRKCKDWTALVAKRKCLWCDGRLYDRP